MVVVQELVLKIIMQILFIFNESDASIKIKQRTQNVTSISSVNVKMTSTAYSSEYLVSVIADSNTYTVLLLTNILHSKDLSLNESYTTYCYHSIKYDGTLKFTQYPMNGTLYIYFISFS